MTRRLGLIVMAGALFLAYRTFFIVVIGYATAVPFPRWWLTGMPRHSHGILAWAVLCHTVGVIIISVPVGWLLARVYGRAGIYLGAAAALLLVAPDICGMVRFQHLMSKSAVIIDAIDYVKIVSILPLLVWLFLRPMSDLRRFACPA